MSFLTNTTQIDNVDKYATQMIIDPRNIMSKKTSHDFKGYSILIERNCVVVFVHFFIMDSLSNDQYR